MNTSQQKGTKLELFTGLKKLKLREKRLAKSDRKLN